jgi:hypothetical protein
LLIANPKKGSAKLMKMVGKFKASKMASKAMNKADEIADNLPHSSKSVPCNLCFYEKTKILLADSSYKNIEDVQIGDYVLASTEGNTHRTFKRVVEKNENVRDSIYQIYFRGIEVKASSNHPFYVVNKFVEVRNLRVGYMLTTYTGEQVRIDSIKIDVGLFKVYNFTVEGYHTYFVSEQRVLVHNCGGTKT